MYQVIYAEKYTQFSVFEKSGIDILFYMVVVRSTKLAALENERLRQASDRRTTDAVSEIKD